MAKQERQTRFTAVIVDDEQLARSLVKEYLSSHPEMDIVAECENGFEAVKAITELKPDIVFLDIQMPKLNGFEVLELLGRDVAVVFATAYDEHAIRAVSARRRAETARTRHRRRSRAGRTGPGRRRLSAAP